MKDSVDEALASYTSYMAVYEAICRPKIASVASLVSGSCDSMYNQWLSLSHQVLASFPDLGMQYQYTDYSYGSKIIIIRME